MPDEKTSVTGALVNDVADHQRKEMFWLTCEDCKEAKVCVKKTKCPFDADVHEKETPAVLCDACYHERGMAI